jgi:hypothetical protein
MLSVYSLCYTASVCLTIFADPDYAQILHFIVYGPDVISSIILLPRYQTQHYAVLDRRTFRSGSSLIRFGGSSSRDASSSKTHRSLAGEYCARRTLPAKALIVPVTLGIRLVSLYIHPAHSRKIDFLLCLLVRFVSSTRGSVKRESYGRTEFSQYSFCAYSARRHTQKFHCNDAIDSLKRPDAN